MEIKEFIKTYDDVLPYKTLSNLLRYINASKFEEARIVGHDDNVIDFNIRRTFTHALENSPKSSMTTTHWFCLLHNMFENHFYKYSNDIKSKDIQIKCINDITVLKYENTGFYTWHTDHCADIPRTLSSILLLNNDYEGGNLCFRNPDGSNEFQIDVKPNRLIIWPSNFLYPHTVKPVTKGTRYSIVSWAL